MKKPKYTEQDRKLAEWIFGKVREVYPKVRQPVWQRWCEDINKLCKRFDITHREIAQLWKWCMNQPSMPNGFSWRANIRSPSKLLKSKDGATYYEIIYQQMTTTKNLPTVNQEQGFIEKHRDPKWREGLT